MTRKKTTQKNLFEDLYRKIGKDGSEKLLQDELQNKDSSRLSFVRVFAYSISAIVHTISIGVFVLGAIILFLSLSEFSFLRFLVAIGLLVVGWFLRPNVGKIPDHTIGQNEFPALFNAIKDLSKEIMEEPIDGIVLTSDFNASYQKVGWNPKRILKLGVPLLHILTVEEFVALIGHELAHDINGDPLKDRFIGTAISSLSKWYSILRPEHLVDFRDGFFLGVITTIANLFMGLISVIPWMFAYLLSHLLWRDSQRAEYLADRLAANISGTVAMTALLKKLFYTTTFTTAIRKFTLNNKPEPLLNLFQKEIESMSDEDYERLVKNREKEGLEFGTSHPPLTYRLKAIESREVKYPVIKISGETYQKILAELAVTHEVFQNKLADAYHRSLVK